MRMRAGAARRTVRAVTGDPPRRPLGRLLGGFRPGTHPRAVLALAVGGLAAGAALSLAGRGEAADLVWALTIAAALAPLLVDTARRLAHGDVGVDLIALVSMGGALALGEELAGAVIAVMLSGGNALEAAAGRRARRELTALLRRAPTVAHRRRDGGLEEVPVDAVAVGDVLVVRAGEVLPVDGEVVGEHALLDESTLTGEPLPVAYTRGDEVRSGTANAGEAFDLRAGRPAAQSAYAALVRLVRDAEGARAPFVRLADRYAAIFLPVTAVIAGAAWILSGDPVRALAVFVVATPCPLILAAPIALVSGVSRAARRGVVVKGAPAIERLAAARTVLFDKTGTLTVGAPTLGRVAALDGRSEEELLRLAASLDQLSAHVIAEALVHAAASHGLRLSMPADVAETPGQGVTGSVDGHRVEVGSPAWMGSRGHAGPAWPDLEAEPGTAHVAVAVDGRPAGVIVLADRLRPEAAASVQALRGLGVRHVALVTGDHRAVAEPIGRAVGVDRTYADCTPEEKLEVVRSLQADEHRRAVVMVGDGINDAPALALADVGIAMAGEGATVSSEAADAVIVTGRVDRVAEAVRIGRRALAVARQSVVWGIALSVIAMGFAAAGQLSPVAGALLQEGIDVAVILNALRALRA
jgi:heavy metal translocating P-type ATPase